MRALLLALASLLVALGVSRPASAHGAGLQPLAAATSASQDSRLALNGQIVEYTYRFQLAAPQLSSGKLRPVRRLASDPSLRWKGMWRFDLGGTELYDARARVWSPALGSFLSIDEFRFHDAKGTLWSWPHQNPLKYADPTGRNPFILAGIFAAAIWLALESPTHDGSVVYAAPILASGGLAAMAEPALAGAAALPVAGTGVGRVAGPGLVGSMLQQCSAHGGDEEPEIEAAEMKASDLLKELNRLEGNRGASKSLTDFFRANNAGGDIKITPGINRDLLLVYRQVAQEAIEAGRDPLGEQLARRDLIDQALGGVP